MAKRKHSVSLKGVFIDSKDPMTLQEIGKEYTNFYNLQNIALEFADQRHPPCRHRHSHPQCGTALAGRCRPGGDQYDLDLCGRFDPLRCSGEKGPRYCIKNRIMIMRRLPNGRRLIFY